MGFVGGVLVVLAMVLSFTVFCGVMYLLQAAGLFAVAKHRGIRKPWLAWLPVANVWILGSISDQYQHLARGCVKKRRKLLTVLQSAAVGGMLLLWVLLAILTLKDAEPGVLFTLCLALLFLGCIAATGTALVLRLLALHDLYASCDPDKSILYLILSIMLPVYPVFILICCRKDLGMPPKNP